MKRAKTKARKATFGDELEQSMHEALAHASGEASRARITEFKKTAVAVKRIRAKVGFTQDRLADVLGVSVSGLRKWEQGQRQPHGAARTLLHVMDREPEAVVRALYPQSTK